MQKKDAFNRPSTDNRLLDKRSEYESELRIDAVVDRFFRSEPPHKYR